MNSLTRINSFIDEDFNDNFKSEEYVKDAVNREDAITNFEDEIEERYNTEFDYVDLCEMKQMCNFNQVMKICEYVAERYEEYDMAFTISHFKDTDKILKAYIYFYIEDNHKQNFMDSIEDEAFDEEGFIP